MNFLRAAGAGAMVSDRPAQAMLLAHDWPGNVRELRNLAERVAVLAHAESPLSALTRPLLLRCAPELGVVKASPISMVRAITQVPVKPARVVVDAASITEGVGRA